MKKNNLIKTIGFSSMALFMGALTIFGFVPMAKAQPLATASETATEYTTEEPAGLITPKADDPVIYTTESGLEIKYGNAIPITTNSSLGSGNLKGFPYFTTTNGSTTYTWVIIGRNPNVTTLSTAVQSYLFSTWKANNPSSDSWKYSNSFFANTYETTTPAGTAINNVVSSKSYVSDNISIPISNITSNSEIPSGGVLCLANNIVGSGVYNMQYGYGGGNEHPQMYTGNVAIRTAMNGYWNNKSFGISSLNIQSVPLKSYAYFWDGKGMVSPLYSENAYIFPLGASVFGGTNFVWDTYLSSTQIKITSNQWLRGLCANESGTYDYSLTSWSARSIDTNGNSVLTPVGKSLGYRPAFVLSLN